MKAKHLIFSKFSHFNHSHSQSHGLALHHTQQRATSRAWPRACLGLCSVLQGFKYGLSNHQEECYIDEMPAHSFVIEPIAKASTGQSSMVPGAAQHLSSSKGTTAHRAGRPHCFPLALWVLGSLLQFSRRATTHPSNAVSEAMFILTFIHPHRPITLINPNVPTAAYWYSATAWKGKEQENSA